MHSRHIVNGRTPCSACHDAHGVSRTQGNPRFNSNLINFDRSIVQPASVGVVPNLPTQLNRFALSTKLFDYVALGVPVVCSDLPTLREHFSDDEVLFFEAGNPRALAHVLEQTANDPEGARRRAQAALRRYEQYRWSVSAERYVAALRACVTR